VDVESLTSQKAYYCSLCLCRPNSALADAKAATTVVAIEITTNLMIGTTFLLRSNNLDSTATAVTPSTLPLNYELNLITWNMRSNIDDRWPDFLHQLGGNTSNMIVLLQETHQTVGYKFQLHDNRFFTIRCDNAENRAMQGVAVMISKHLVQDRTTPTVIFSDNGRSLIVDFTDILGQVRRVASLYFPSDGARDRMDYMNLLPWPTLAYAYIGCDSNLRCSSADITPAASTIERDGLMFCDYLTLNNLDDMWVQQPNRIMTFRPSVNSKSSPTCIDRIVIPHRDAVARPAAQLRVHSHISLSDHSPVQLVIGVRVPNTLPRLLRRVPTFVLADDVQLRQHVRDMVLRAIARLNAGSRAIDLWQPLLHDIQRVIERAHASLTSSISKRHQRNLERRDRQIHHEFLLCGVKFRVPGCNVAEVIRERQEIQSGRRNFVPQWMICLGKFI
jgi:exonuclease III